MKSHLSLALAALLALCLSGCAHQGAQATSSVGTPVPASQEETNTLKKHMSRTFAALEMYAADNGSHYPKELGNLVPRYLEGVPRDPVSREPLTYEKTDEGFLLGCEGDYSAVNAEPGFPKMNQDGFFVLKSTDFPSRQP